MSPKLQEFYNAYLEWMQFGAPVMGVNNPFGFTRDCGLCSNYIMGFLGSCWAIAIEELEELKQQFRDAGLDDEYPFNSDSLHYYNEICLNASWLNEKRIAWVEQHANRT